MAGLDGCGEEKISNQTTIWVLTPRIFQPAVGHYTNYVISALIVIVLEMFDVL